MHQVRMLPPDETSTADLAAIRHLLVDAFDGRFTDEDWEHTHGGRRVVVFEGEVPLSHAAIVPRRLRVAGRPFRTGYVEGVATKPERQGRGLGSLVMARVTDLVREEFELGALSTGRRGFYRRIGWESWRGPSFVQDGSDLVRTPDEDDGLLVLRFGPSAEIDLAAPIVCERRPGDDW